LTARCRKKKNRKKKKRKKKKKEKDGLKKTKKKNNRKRMYKLSILVIMLTIGVFMITSSALAGVTDDGFEVTSEQINSERLNVVAGGTFYNGGAPQSDVFFGDVRKSDQVAPKALRPSEAVKISSGQKSRRAGSSAATTGRHGADKGQQYEAYNN
jgi:hypothetical protein